MSTITSRKHAAASQPRRHASTALALAALELPGTIYAQASARSAAPAAPAASTSLPAHDAATLPVVKVQAAPETDYKADRVASPKFTQPLVDTPQTITVIKKELLQQQAVTSLAEALRNTPGVTMQLGENGSTQTGDSINLRGFDSSQSIFVDGIRDLGAVSRDVFNIDQVEVVKGPSGSDNGRGASSAYINLVSKTAQRGQFATVTGTLGDARRKRFTADLNTPLDLGIPGSAVRLNLMDQDNGAPGRDKVRAKRWGLAPTITFGLGTPSRQTFSYLHIQQDNRPDGGVSTFGLPGYAYGTGTTALKPGPRVRSANYYGLNSDFDHVKMDLFTALIENDLTSTVKLRNTTRIGRTAETVVVTGVNAVTTPTVGGTAAFTATRSRQGRRQDNEILTNQTNLSSEFSTWRVKHSLSTGVELIYERQHTRTPIAIAGQANLYAPNADDNIATPSYTGNFSLGSTLTGSAYAFDTLKIGARWLINGGVRVDKFHTDTSVNTNATSTAAAINGNYGLTDTVWSYKVGAVFKPADNGSVYLTYSDSRQPPGGTNFALSAQPNSQARPNLKPQEGSNIEVGTKWDLLDGNLSATAAVYRSQNKNELFNQGTTAAPNYVAIGKRRVDGFELGLVGQITRALNVSTGFSHMDTKILSGASTQQSGVLTFSPKNTFTSWVTYKLPLGITLGGGERYVDKFARSSNTAAPTTFLLNTSSYWVTDAMASYDVTKNTTLQLNVYNLFDKFYIQSLNNGGSRYTPGAERNGLLSATVRF